jgi:hypothetical protein
MYTNVAARGRHDRLAHILLQPDVGLGDVVNGCKVNPPQEQFGGAAWRARVSSTAMERNLVPAPKKLVLMYQQLRVGADAWIRAGLDELRDFQLCVAAAEAWEFIGAIHIIDIREERFSGERLIDAVRIRRLK